jgi:hypothetical protein
MRCGNGIRIPLSITALLSAAALVALPSTAAAQTRVAAPSWNGTWTETVSGDPAGHIYLTQKSGSSKVTGTYTFCDGKVVGTTANGVLTGTWTQKWPCGSARVGNGQFILRQNAQGTAFTGQWGFGASTTDTAPFPQGWSGTLQSLVVPGTPPAATEVGPWSGIWTQTLPGATGTPLYLIQRKSSSTVTGWYGFCDGVVKGTVSGSALTGAWTQKPGCGGAVVANGRFAFRLGASGKKFAGTWGYGKSATDSRGGSNVWSGILQHR